MKKLLLLVTLASCAHPSVELLGANQNYVVITTNKRGKATRYECSKIEQVREQVEEYDCKVLK